MKRVILVTSPPASGKTYVTRALAKAMPNCVYLDKDTLIVLSKQIFQVANEKYDRSSQFFEDYIRNPEYDCVMELAFEALDYNDTVFINAPFTREIRDAEYIKGLRDKLIKKEAILEVVWVETDLEVIHQRMILRNSDRDTWKLTHWEEYVEKQNYDAPSIENLIVFYNSSEEEFDNSIKDVTARLSK